MTNNSWLIRRGQISVPIATWYYPDSTAPGSSTGDGASGSGERYDHIYLNKLLSARTIGTRQLLAKTTVLHFDIAPIAVNWIAKCNCKIQMCRLVGRSFMPTDRSDPQLVAKSHDMPSYACPLPTSPSGTSPMGHGSSPRSGGCNHPATKVVRWGATET